MADIENSSEKKVLLFFLKLGYTTRKMDELLESNSKLTKGWKSWKILKKYKLISNDKGVLFVFTKKQANTIILELMKLSKRESVIKFLKSVKPDSLKKYKDTFVLAKDEGSYLGIMSGECRNLIRSFYINEKKSNRNCQYEGCESKVLDTVHLKESRPAIFKNAAAKSIISKIGKLNKYNVFETMKLFLEMHRNKHSICFLCKKHHNGLHNAEGKGNILYKKFIKKIIW